MPFISFPILVYPSSDEGCGGHIAHCLNMDLIADADTVEGAVSELLETIEAALEGSNKHQANVFRDAPQEYWDKLAKGSELSRAMMERIIFDANLRHHTEIKNIEQQLDIRELQPA